jgi:sporulation protein YlmC with PRC-barrel domain
MIMGRNRDTRRDQAGVGPDPAESRRRLISMDDLDGYAVADGEPDVRGWDVATVGGRELGAVEDLLVDPERGEVVMLEVALRGDDVHAEVPVRHVQLDRKRKMVIVDSGDLESGSRYDIRARDRMDAAERERVRETYRDTGREVRYSPEDERRDDRTGDRHDREAAGRTPDDGAEETVIERRPVIEEVVVRRRTIEE